MMRTARQGLIAVVAAVAVGLGSLPSAAATENDGADEVAAVIDAIAPDAGLGDPAGLGREGGEIVADDSAGQVDVPTDPAEPVRLESGDASFAVGLPDLGGLDAPSIAQDGTVVYEGEVDAQIAVQAFDQGVRFLAVLKGDAAPERYEFPVEVPDGGSLALTDSGAVDILAADGTVVATSPAPWAYDADGVAVPTHFEVDGNTVVQVVEHRGGGFSYPIVADPSWWQITKCAGAIAWVIGSSIFAVAKILKIKKYIQALGGVTQTAKLLMGATTAAERAAAIGKGFLALAAIITGVDGIVSNCRA